MAEMSVIPSAGPRLTDIFEEIWSIYQSMEESSEPTNSENNQLALARVTKKCEAAIEMVNILSLFSTNENIDEVATNEIRFMLLSALLGYFTMKRSSSATTRRAIVSKSKVYYIDYLNLCGQYGLIDHWSSNYNHDDNVAETAAAGPTTTDRPLDIPAMSNTRAEKIKQYKQTQEEEVKLRDLHAAVIREHVDEEVKRDYYLALVKKFIRTSLGDLDCIKTEIEMLQFMEQRVGQAQPTKKNPTKVTRPFIITKTELQKKVYGAGYPSISTMTIDEFYQQKVDEGTFQPSRPSNLQSWAEDPDKAKQDKEDEAAVDEDKEDREDEESLSRQRGWDDWKDEHRRGDGNRQNMG